MQIKIKIGKRFFHDQKQKVGLSEFYQTPKLEREFGDRFFLPGPGPDQFQNIMGWDRDRFFFFFFWTQKIYPFSLFFVSVYLH